MTFSFTPDPLRRGETIVFTAGSTPFIDSAGGFGHSVKGFFTNLFSN